NSRTPMQWNSQENGGFTTGTPWMKVNPNHKEINVAQQLEDPDSILNYYKKMIETRKAHDVFVYGVYDLALADHDQVYAYTRQLGDRGAFILANLFDEDVEIEVPTSIIEKQPELLLTNNAGQTELKENMVLKPYEAKVYHW